MDEGELAEAQAMFRHFDADGNQLLEAEELVQLMGWVVRHWSDGVASEAQLAAKVEALLRHELSIGSLQTQGLWDI